jgi:sialidase-1
MLLFCCATCADVSAADQPRQMAPELRVEGKLESFLGEPEFETRQIFAGERFPNVAVALDGTVVATWGRSVLRARRSEDGGETWGAEIAIAKPGFHGGGLTVDETTGDLLVFAQDKHPPSPAHLYRSTDHGKTWKQEELAIEKDILGHLPQVHMAESGITLRHSRHKGRLIRAARHYGTNIRVGDDGYNMAIYSDDSGKTWQSSEPFPMMGTGEGAIVELSDGRLYYSSRKHWFKTEGDKTHKRSFAWSEDGGKTWIKGGFADALPDGPQYRGNQRRGGCYNGHYGIMCGLVRLPINGRDILIYSNPDTEGASRIRMTVWASFDGGKTWPVKRLVLEDGHSAYSSLAAGRPGTVSDGWIYLQYEGSGGAYVSRFNLSWLLAGEKTGDGELPKWLETTK